jgi:serine/threonine protein kinase
MPLIPAAHVNLAGPPSLQTCTRDVYPPGFQLSTRMALEIATDVASALAHLHQRGVMHGDLYAHNILFDPVHGQAQLGDFGAATRLPSNQAQLRLRLQALEVRALGCLLEELAAATVAHTEHPSAPPFQSLAQACLCAEPRQRPTAADVAEALKVAHPC